MINVRKPISKKTRFEVFKRDNFKCQYCGNVPPKSILEVDHITPVVLGGKNNIDNLLTACFDCNRGKGKTELTSLPESTASKADILKEKAEQYKKYVEMQERMELLVSKDLDSVSDVYSGYFEGWELKDRFKRGSVKKFVDFLGVVEVRNAMHIACSKIHWNEDKALKYFCGVCWGKIKESL